MSKKIAIIGKGNVGKALAVGFTTSGSEELQKITLCLWFDNVGNASGRPKEGVGKIV